MKKIININLSGRVIPIEDSAYESLQRYIESLRRYFANEEGRDEIINDIESRIAELMNDQIRKGATAITDADIEQIIHSMGRIEDFEQADAAESATAAASAAGTGGTGTTGTTTTGAFRPRQRLYRDANDKLLGGVCSGIANYMNIDPAIVRLIFAIISLGGFGAGFLLYVLLWIILPVRSLETYTGKRLFRNPEDKVLSGVAGGLAAYFNTSSALVRIIFVAPLIINIIFGTLSSIFWVYHHEFFPNFFFGSLTGTFILTYIILWIVLPEARTPFEKMEMRGEKVDVNRIRQNVKDEMENIKARAQAWGEEVKTSAQQIGERARTFANTRGRTFAGEVAEASRPVATGVGHVLGTIFKAFFMLIAGAIALAFFALLMVLIFGGVAWWPINNFLWTSSFQKAMAWGTILLFIAVPLVGFIVWLVRRIAGVRRRNSYLGWTFGGLWTLGWFCAILFAVSISKDLRTYERTGTDVPISQPAHGRMIVRVNEPEIHNTENIWWLHTGGNGLDVTEDSMRYNNAKVRVEKSNDSDYHVTVYRYSAGSNYNDAQNRASRIRFNVSSQDSILNLGSGLAIGRDSKFRGQGVIVTIQVPVGKKIRFDDSILEAYDSWMLRRPGYWDHRWGRHYAGDWDNDEGFDWTANVDYVMGSDGILASTARPANTTDNDETDNSGNNQTTTVSSGDSLRLLREEQKRVRDSMDRELRKTEQELRQNKNPKPTRTSEEITTQLGVPNVALLVI